ISKPLLQKLITRDHKHPEIQKMIKDIFAFTETHTRTLSVKRVEFISIVESTVSGFKISISKPIREIVIANYNISKLSMIQLLEATTLGLSHNTQPIRKFVETLSAGQLHIKQLLHVLYESTPLLQYRQSRVTSQLVHRLGILSGEGANINKVFTQLIVSSGDFLRRPQKHLQEGIVSAHITSRHITSFMREQLYTLNIVASSPVRYLRERLTSSDSFRHRIAGLATRPYTTAKAISKNTKVKLNKSFATLKQYTKDTSVSHEGDE
ncbi:MAG: hypothetical protein M0P69_19355, partial [Bacteroidales bacterium]|nr:hypothetical protein [Bacteroidales bacterium]